eukprot:2861063-Amphidinium_carterae.1
MPPTSRVRRLLDSSAVNLDREDVWRTLQNAESDQQQNRNTRSAWPKTGQLTSPANEPPGNGEMAGSTKFIPSQHIFWSTLTHAQPPKQRGAQDNWQAKNTSLGTAERPAGAEGPREISEEVSASLSALLGPEE